MPLMQRLIREHTVLSPSQEEWLTRLVANWQLIADLSFSDLVLWVPDEDPEIFWAVAQVRPNTGPTALEDDVAGTKVAYQPEHGVPEAYLSDTVVETSENKLQAGIPVDVHAIPIHHDGEVLAVIERHTNQMGVRAPGALEDNYLELAETLTAMAARGEFPVDGAANDPVLSPRVGDGLIRLDARGRVLHATPNAVTAYRRLGLATDLEDDTLVSTTTRLIATDPDAPSTDEVGSFFGDESVAEIVVSVGMISVRLRRLPLKDADGGPAGAILLCRDVTELNKRERQLVTKDATIREIHHRVKNNLQTVAALLRMQARRTSSEEARTALSEAQSRVAAIAVVHETLSQAFDEEVQFDDVADRVLKMVGEVAAMRGGEGLTTRREGSFGLVPADVATSLSLVVTELCQNAIEHGLAAADTGVVRIVPRATEGWLSVEVTDDGSGLPDDFALERSRSLGLSIVSTLIHDLGGTFEIRNNAEAAGSTARITIPISR
ncbi:PAS domain-containing sensor histidine kinase [Mariniluteicoccus endophyticus]